MGAIRTSWYESTWFKAGYSPSFVFCSGAYGLLYYKSTSLNRSQDISLRNAVDRPFAPPIHVLILPSKLPLDFRLHFRDLDEEYMVRRAGSSLVRLAG
jgi:hypothetical protein